MEDPTANDEGGLGSGVASDAKVVEIRDDRKDEKVDKVAGIDDDEEEFDLVSPSMYSLPPGASLNLDRLSRYYRCLY
jgi:hypothetical protein